MIEIWKDIKGYENIYQVSNLGRVKSLNRLHGTSGRIIYKEKVLKPSENKNGYYSVKLKGKPFKIHRLVLETFYPINNSLLEINHIDSNKANNKLENLEWVTHKQNMEHASINKLFKDRRKSVLQYDKFGNFIREWASIKEAGETLQISCGNISNCCSGKQKQTKNYIWKYKQIEN